MTTTTLAPAWGTASYPAEGARAEGPLRILMASSRYLPYMGGTETHVREVARRLVGEGHSVTVLTSDPSGELPPSETIDGVEVMRVKAWPEKRDYYLAPGLFAKVQRGQWDVGHVQGYHNLFAPAAMMAMNRKGLPFVITFHGGGHDSPLRNSLRDLQAVVLKPLVARAANLIGCARHEAETFSRRMGFPLERFAVVYNGAGVPQASPGIRPVLDPPTLISVGRLVRYKGHHRVIEAMPYFLESYPQGTLRVLGSGPYEPELRKRVAKLGLEAHVSIGSIPPEDRQALADTIAAAALVVIMSEYEGHPIAVLEALALRRPVLGARVAGVGELADQGYLRSVPLDASAELLGRAMAAEVAAQREPPPVELPTWDGCAAQLLDIYHRVIREASSS